MKTCKNINVRLAVVSGMLLAAFAVAGCEEQKSGPADLAPEISVTSFPEKLDPACRNGRAQLFDECADQLELFKQAADRARAENKVLLVSYGAEWCIWCHVFDAYIRGGQTKFQYTIPDPEQGDEQFSATLYEREKKDVTESANRLHKLVAESFVIVHIDYLHASGADTVLGVTGADEFYEDHLPYIFTVDDKGRYAASLDYSRVQIRRDTWDWYRGYERADCRTVRNAECRTRSENRLDTGPHGRL